MAMRWRCPPESITPRFADHGLVAFGKAHDKVAPVLLWLRIRSAPGLRLRGHQRRCFRQSCVRRGKYPAQLCRSAAQAVHAPLTHIDIVDQHAPCGRIKGAVEQLGQRTLARQSARQSPLSHPVWHETKSHSTPSALNCPPPAPCSPAVPCPLPLVPCYSHPLTIGAKDSLEVDLNPLSFPL